MSTAGIDDTDLDGRTALSWAASRGDGEAVKVLLKYHANPNVECRKCISPLQYACQTNTTSCIKPLLDAGAAPNHANAWKYRPLHYVALYQDDERLVNLLVKFGAFLDARDDYERTPLARASTNGRAKSAAALLDGGADIDAVDAAGDPPLFLAISHNAHEVIRLLLRHGADYSIRRKSKNHSILHLAAQKADRTTLEILTGAGMDGLDPEERDEQGLAPGDIILARLDRSIELVEAFDSLVRSTNYLFDRDGECQDEVESEAYEDAMEKLSALESTLE